MKEAEVTRAHREAADALMENIKMAGAMPKSQFAINTIAAGLAAAERSGASRAGQEGWDMLVKAAAVFDFKLRFIPCNKQWLVQVGGSEALGTTPTDAARELCRKLGLLPPPPVKP